MEFLLGQQITNLNKTKIFPQAKINKNSYNSFNKKYVKKQGQYYETKTFVEFGELKCAIKNEDSH